ncbi:MAG: hypothetical protein Q8O67_10645 [Deltaproteobacteria bacterium]|nr:hypothetical protein [Deltaproteobacteria bacterium]
MTAPGTTQQAEHLWVTAHEHVRRGDFAAATRDLSACFQILQALKDPRVAEVHKRWTEVHKLYVEDGARAAPSTSKPVAAPTLEAEAEAAANAGNLENAILLYEQALQKQPQNELVAERLIELRAARPRAAELTEKRSEPAVVAVVAVAAVHHEVAAAVVAARVEPVAAVVEVIEVAAVVVDVPVSNGSAIVTIAEDDFGDINEPEPVVVAVAAVVTSSAPAVAVSDGLELDDATADIHNRETLVPTAAATHANVMAASEAGVGLQSLDVDIDMGESVSADVADDLPVSSVAEPAAVEQPLSAEDPRWGAPSAPIAGLSAEDPRWGAPSTPLPPEVAEPTGPSADDLAKVALLEQLSVRVKSNRRAA